MSSTSNVSVTRGPGWVEAAVWLLALLPLVWIGMGESSATPKRGSRRSSGQQPSLADCTGCNVVLVSIDTLRADHLGFHGYPRPTSPTLDALAREAVVFDNAYSASFVTADAHMSMFTSVFPSVHGVRNAVPAERKAQRLPSELTTLPQWLREAGYATAAFTSGGNVSASYGFDRGMDTYRVHADTTTGVARSLAFARDRSAEGRPFFVFLHTYETHDPYLPPAEIAELFYEAYLGDVVRSREQLLERQPDVSFELQRAAYWDSVDKLSQLDRRQLVAAYDAEIRSVDEALAPLWDGLSELGRTLIVVTSDHGEQFGEHGGFLHNDVYEELLHVPLIVHHPDGPSGVRVKTAVSTMDIAPTLLQVVGLPSPPQVQGRSLRALSALSPRPVLAERSGGAQALIEGSHKLIMRPKRHAELYDLQQDPGEHSDQARRQRERTRALQGQLDVLRRVNQSRASALRRDSHALDERLARQLEALGYGVPGL